MVIADDPGDATIRAGLIGRGILESRTPWMHEREAAAQGLKLHYALLDFSARGWTDDDLPALLDCAEGLGFAGINVTFPFKQAVVARLDALAPGAELVGAVNTVDFRQGRRIGHNTDVTGFAASFRDGLAGAAVHTVLQLGCGGAGSATACAMLGQLGAERLLLHDPDQARRDHLAAQLAGRFGADRIVAVADVATAAAEADGILNASPVGMSKFPGIPLPVAALEARHWVADVVYFPLHTELLTAARAIGCRTLDGGGMAVHQAADAFTIFTGLPADSARMATSFAAFARNARPAADAAIRAAS